MSDDAVVAAASAAEAPATGEPIDGVHEGPGQAEGLPEPTPADASPEPVEPETPTTGVAAADDAARRLEAIADAPLEDHVAIYDDVHRRLQEGLAELDEG